MPEITPNTKAAYRLFHDGTLVLSEIEQTGMQVDVVYIEKMQAELKNEIQTYYNYIYASDEVTEWRKHNPSKTFNPDSPIMLSDALFKYGGCRPFKTTKTGKPSIDEESLKELKIPLVLDILRFRKLSKVNSTYLGNFYKEQVDGIMRPIFNLHFVSSFRSSSDSPNFQNIPKHDKESQQICRRAIIPRPGYMLGEIDYSGAEVRCSYVNHHDPKMYEYLTDPSTDMHRDMAMQCYKLELEQMTKQIRGCAKTGFVFSQFYGDYYINNARNLWQSIERLGLKTAQDIPLFDHLRSKGIKTLTQFENHIRDVEYDFWNNRFKIYGQWKEDLWEEYSKTGEFYLHSGFTCRGVFDRKQVCNYPIQGFAFHWLLWSLIQLHKEIKKRGFKTKIIGQIHDSIVFDFWPPELNHIIRLANKIMTKDIVKHWPVISIPLGIEVDVAPVNKDWACMRGVKNKGRGCPECGNQWLYWPKNGAQDVGCPVCRAKFILN